MIYQITGSFQYDVGIVGLMKVLDFFGESYQTDGKFYVEVDKSFEELLELCLLKGWYDLLVNSSRVELKLNKELMEKGGKKKKEKKIRMNPQEFGIDFVAKIKKLRSLKKFLAFFADEIAKKEELGEFDVEDVLNYLWVRTFLNFDSYVKNFIGINSTSKIGKGRSIEKGEELFEKAVSKLKGEETEGKGRNNKGKTILKKTCSFCGQHDGVPATRDLFFMGTSQINQYWFSDPKIFICPYCAVLTFAVPNVLKSRKGIFFYAPSLDEIGDFTNSFKEALNSIMKKVSVRKEATRREKQIIEYKLSDVNEVEIYFLTPEVFEKICHIWNDVKNEDEKSWYGEVKAGRTTRKFNLLDETIKAILSGNSLYNLAYGFISFSLKARRKTG